MDEYNNFQKKTLPHDPEAERSIISSMICEMGAAIYANENLNANDFYNQAHKIIFDTINELILENKKIDKKDLDFGGGDTKHDFGANIKQLGKNIWSLPVSITEKITSAMSKK